MAIAYKRPTLVQAPRMGRRMRRPSHPFQIKHQPWQIQPCMIAPVLPGESLENLLLQSRAVTDPIKNPLIGWWLEYHFFYVKHRDLDARDLLTTMMLDPDVTTSTLNTAANVKTYHLAASVDWVSLCLKRIVDTYFRDEDELAAPITIDGMPIAHTGMTSWMDSLAHQDKYGADADVELVVGADDKITASEMDATMRMWEFQRANALTDMSYEDFLATYGIKSPKEENHRPELIRSVREWTYPVNHIDPATGSPSSAVSWSIAERADKKRFFREPGFVIGVSIARPKVYFSKQQGSVTALMNNAITWLPAILSDDPYTSLVNVPAGQYPLDDSTAGYWLDLKDLLLYGEQFVNFATSEVGSGFVALPANDAKNRRFASSVDAESLFVAPLTAKNVRQDGVVNLTIAGTVVDTSTQGIQG